MKSWHCFAIDSHRHTNSLIHHHISADDSLRVYYSVMLCERCRWNLQKHVLQLQWGESPPSVGGVSAIIPRSSSASNKRIVTESFQHSTTLDCSGEAAISVNQWVLSARGLLRLRNSSRSRKLKNLIIMLQQKQPLCHNKKSPCDSHNNSLKFILKWDQRGRCCYFIAQHSKESF